MIPSGHPLVAQLVRRFPGVRIPRTRRGPRRRSCPAILEQKVTGEAARRAWFGLIRVYGEAAPGPPELAPPPPARRRRRLPALPYYAYHPFGVERRRADLIRRVASRAAWFEGIVDLPLPEAYARLTARARDRAVDRGRGRRPGARRRRRGERRRLPPARTSSRTRSPASRAARTRGCSSCSSPIAGSGRASSGSSS